jgi:histone-lysine N-methyltransferase SUV39H
MEDNLTNEWRRTQKRRRDAILKDSIDIELGPFSGVDLHNDSTRLRAQAYEEKLALRRRYSPKLEEQMAKLLAEKLGPGTDLDDSPSPTSAGPATPAGRGLRLSTVRQHRQKSVPLQLLGSVRGRDDARISRAPSSSSWSSKSYKAVSASSSASSSIQEAIPSAQIDRPHYSQSENATATPTRDSQDRASRKRKVSEVEVGYESRQQRYQFSHLFTLILLDHCHVQRFFQHATDGQGQGTYAQVKYLIRIPEMLEID